jgi:hypothetical protein
MVIPDFSEKAFTTEARSSQRSENFFNQELFTPCPEPVLSDVEGRLRGAISESCLLQESLKTLPDNASVSHVTIRRNIPDKLA